MKYKVCIKKLTGEKKHIASIEAANDKAALWQADKYKRFANASEGERIVLIGA